MTDSVDISQSKEKSKGYNGKKDNKDKTKDKEKSKTTVVGVAPKPTKTTHEPTKKVFRIVIRKLPVRDFSSTDFATCVDKVCKDLKLTREVFVIEHFIEGKLRFEHCQRCLIASI